jgi:hypothetical protein
MVDNQKHTHMLSELNFELIINQEQKNEKKE